MCEFKKNVEKLKIHLHKYSHLSFGIIKCFICIIVILKRIFYFRDIGVFE